jgi:hypothetical protein
MMPGTTAAAGRPVYDVDSSTTAAEKRAPYGDSYNLNRFERPFLQDMTYNPNLDIVTFNLSQDESWYYVWVKLVGSDPNDQLGIHYGLELDTNRDGFGDYIIWARPPFSSDWDTSNVQVYADKNQDTGGLSAIKSEASFQGDGYETLIFDGGKGDEPDLAWVRAVSEANATLQFAFKKTLAGSSFMYGVVADGGLKNPGLYDYNDRFNEAEAGSPIRNKTDYPLKALYAVDNTCWEAFGFTSTGYEPKICPKEPPPAPTKKTGGTTGTTAVSSPTPDYCTSIGRPDPGNCPFPGWSGPPYCMCIPP